MKPLTENQLDELMTNLRRVTSRMDMAKAEIAIIVQSPSADRVHSAQEALVRDVEAVKAWADCALVIVQGG